MFVFYIDVWQVIQVSLYKSLFVGYYFSFKNTVENKLHL